MKLTVLNVAYPFAPIGPDAVEKIPRNIISEMNPSKVSLMPAGIDKQITKQEMADLLEFLQQRK